MTIATILAGKGADVVRVDRGTSVAEVVALLSERRIGAVPVMDGDAVVGILSERDVLHCLADEGAAMLAKRAVEVMTAPPVTVTRDTPILAALGTMTRRRVRHLPVVEGERLVGFVSIGDLVKARVDRAEQEALALREYIQSA